MNNGEPKYSELIEFIATLPVSTEVRDRLKEMVDDAIDEAYFISSGGV